MLLIAGLGNPGASYERTRHNIGFMILDAFQQHLSAPPYRMHKEFHAQLSQVNYKGNKLILAKPQTFMNASGVAVLTIMSYYRLTTQELIIVHDDADLSFGRFKAQQGRGAGGHHGVESVIEHLKEKKFMRLRVGISPALQEKRQKSGVFVLQAFSSKEKKALQDIIQHAISILEMLLDSGLEKTAQKFN